MYKFQIIIKDFHFFTFAIKHIIAISHSANYMEMESKVIPDGNLRLVTALRTMETPKTGRFEHMRNLIGVPHYYNGYI